MIKNNFRNVKMSRKYFPQIQIYSLDFLKNLGIDKDEFIDSFIESRIKAFNLSLSKDSLTTNFATLKYSIRVSDYGYSDTDDKKSIHTYGIYNNGYNDIFKRIANSAVKGYSSSPIRYFLSNYIKKISTKEYKNTILNALKIDVENLLLHNYTDDEIKQKNSIFYSRKILKIAEAHGYPLNIFLKPKIKDFEQTMSCVISLILIVINKPLNISLGYLSCAIAKEQYSKKLLSKLSPGELIESSKYKSLSSKIRYSTSDMIKQFSDVVKSDRDTIINGFNENPSLGRFSLRYNKLVEAARELPRNSDSSVIFDKQIFINKLVDKSALVFFRHCIFPKEQLQTNAFKRKLRLATLKLINNSRASVIEDCNFITFHKLFLMMSLPESLEKIVCKNKIMFKKCMDIVNLLLTRINKKVLTQALLIKNLQLAKIIKDKKFLNLLALESDSFIFQQKSGEKYFKITPLLGFTKIITNEKLQVELEHYISREVIENISTPDLILHNCKIIRRQKPRTTGSDLKDWINGIRLSFKSQETKSAVVNIDSYLFGEGVPSFSKEVVTYKLQFGNYLMKKTNMKHIAILEKIEAQNINLDNIINNSLMKMFQKYPGTKIGGIL